MWLTISDVYKSIILLLCSGKKEKKNENEGKRTLERTLMICYYLYYFLMDTANGQLHIGGWLDRCIIFRAFISGIFKLFYFIISKIILSITPYYFIIHTISQILFFFTILIKYISILFKYYLFSLQQSIIHFYLFLTPQHHFSDPPSHFTASPS